jgi:hypothetical protein
MLGNSNTRERPRTEPKSDVVRNCRLSAADSLRLHWPEYLMEAGAAGVYLFSVCAVATLLWHPASPVHYWTNVLALFSGVILRCFLGTVAGGPGVAVFLLPTSGLFMSVIYPSINSKGISCFSEHGAIAGVILFFTCFSAVMGPMAMAAVSDTLGNPKYGFILATGFAGLLFVGLLLNWFLNPTRELLKQLDETEYL